MRLSLSALALAAMTTLTACAAMAPEPTPEPVVATMRWDHRPEASEWTQASFAALQTDSAPLVDIVPGDIETWCPKYLEGSRTERAAFWTGLMSALAKHESTWNPEAVGGGGRWFGLVQIDPSTARGYGCEARTGSALRDGASNLTCAFRIASSQVARYGTVSRGMRDWGPFHSASKRQDMRDWVSNQPYCSAE
ncbi:transglycosylase SLT domain-containing protein [Roseisalinus antarcticus]|uniref:Transglycosylase SLT domain protein n=1 Tax=Roseisalinus antarcticus TaxID=254357 RepID=A0A1Y5SL73_9RHOB|nr:transglycosylase SLT domain-containing protein [Roseisalinus antarcticus]SLN40245.1 Transglycosylase SLT domain protein [Roseisalinus antarcticus]